MKDFLDWLKSLSDGQWCMVAGAALTAYSVYAMSGDKYFYTGLGVFFIGLLLRIWKAVLEGKKK